MTEVFPYEKIPKNSKVIIYGIGKFGKLYINQIKYTQWCEIVGIMDSYNKENYGEYKNININELSSVKFDYIIISINSIKIQIDVYHLLKNYNVPDKCILCDLKNYIAVKERTYPYISLLLSGGLGDFIVFSSFYNKLSYLYPNCIIDIYGRELFCKSIYGMKKNIRKIRNLDETEITEMLDTDIIIRLQYMPYIEYCDKNLEKRFPELYALICKINSHFLSRIHFKSTMEYSAVLKIAEIYKYNRYQLLGLGDVLDLDYKIVEIDFDKNYLQYYKALKLKKYITLNYGANKLVGDPNKIQTKVWPIEHYNNFVRLFKRKYADIEVIQIGAEVIKRIEECDKYIFGESLELIKYILKNSLLHIDCEGGLVHLASVIGTKCAVLFGPTPIGLFGYSDNINISAENCVRCMAYSDDWFTECALNMEKPKCMYGITPEMVMDEIAEYMDERNK